MFLLGSNKGAKKSLRNKTKGKKKKGKSQFASEACASATYFFFFKFLNLKYPKRSDIMVDDEYFWLKR